jgi:hypothetical protein
MKQKKKLAYTSDTIKACAARAIFLIYYIKGGNRCPMLRLLQ